MDNFKELLARSADKFGSETAFTLKRNGEYTDISYIRFNEEVKSLATAMIAKGLAGERIAIIGPNSYHWFMVNAAAQICGCVTVPLDKDLKYGEFLQSLERCEAKAIFFDKKQESNTKEAFRSGKTKIEYAYPLFQTDQLETVITLLEEGKVLVGNGDVSLDHTKVDPDAVSMLIFTSGTTSQSKIVMLSQRNVCTNIVDMIGAIPLLTTDTNIALLPYHHMFGSTGQWLMLANGVRTVYCDGLKYIQKNLKEYGVSVFVGVPLIIEQMYKKIMKTAEKEGLDGRIKRFSKVTRLLNRAKIDVRRQIFHGVLDALGGKLRLVVLGASAADPTVIQGFNDFGITCIQGYGLTETAPVLTAERPNNRKPGSVGLPLESVELMIDDPDEKGVGEVLAKGDNIMHGYYGNREATDAVLHDGWFHTGDLGYIDKSGFLFLSGRKKNVIVLKNGKNVFPEELEVQIASLPYQLENIVVGLPNKGDERDLVVSLKIVYDPSYFPGQTREEIQKKIQADVDAINEKMPAYKRIKRIFVTDEPMIKTSTSKVRRFLEIEKMLKEEERMEEARKAKSEAQDNEAQGGEKAPEGE